MSDEPKEGLRLALRDMGASVAISITSETGYRCAVFLDATELAELITEMVVVLANMRRRND
jgi:hypothetical protein